MTEPCRHHWRIAEANGSPTVHGVCRECGAEHDYSTAGIDLEFQLHRHAIPSRPAAGSAALRAKGARRRAAAS